MRRRFLLSTVLVASLAQGGGAVAQVEEEPAAPAPRVVGWDIEGTLIDDRASLDAFVETIVRPGAFFVETGPADRVGLPIGTVPRLRRGFEDIGYEATVETKADAGGTRLVIRLRPFDRVRYFFVRGNWPLRQDEILRQLSLRAGQALPMAGSRRNELLADETERVLGYLRNEGYLDARAAIDIEVGKGVPTPVNLIVRLELGKGYPVGRISVQGNKAVSTEVIDDLFRHNDWRFLWTRPLPFKQSLLREDEGKLKLRYQGLGYPAMGLITSTATDRGQKQVDLELTVNERKKVEVAFVGNDCCLDSTLRDALTIFRNGSFSDYDIEESVGSLTSFYRSRGHMLAKVSAERRRVSATLEKVTFTIVEGPRLKVRFVDFEGNVVYSDDRLRGVVAVKKFPLLGAIGLGAGGYASPSQLELDVEALQDFYRAAGFPSVKARVEIAPAPTGWKPLAQALADAETDPVWRKTSSLYVRFFVDEGPRVSVGSIRFAAEGGGSLPYDDTFLRASILSTVGGPYRPALVREDEGRLLRLMRDAGYPYAEPKPEVTRDGNEEHIAWTIALGPKVLVGPVFIRGNFITRPRTIRHWIPLVPGQPLTLTGFERGQRNLALLQLFNNASPIRFSGQDERREVVPMIVQVEERHDHWGVIRVGGGASTEQAAPDSSFPLGAYAAAGYEHRNLLGLGYNFQSQLAIGNSLTRALASFQNPRLFGTLFRLELQGTYLKQATVRLGDIESWSAFIGLARQMAPGVDAFIRYNIRDVLRTEFLVRMGGPDQRQSTVRLDTVIGSVSLGLDWLRLDNPLVPTRGFRLSGSVELANPVFSFGAGQDSFVKAQGRGVVVIPALSWLSVRNTLRWDQGIPLGASVLPKVERYFAGGDTTVRGYALDRVRTEVIRTPFAPGVDLVQVRPIGGSMRIINNFELVFPLAPPIYGSVFLDSGLVADSLDGFDVRRFRHGFGVSPLLVRLPVGDISFSWAWPIDPGPGDTKIGRLHFNVGLMF